MATGPGSKNLDAQPNAILVVINTDLTSPLDKPARCPFPPEAGPASAPIMGLSRLDGESERFRVYVSMHEQLARRKIGCDDRDHPGAVKLRCQLEPFLDLLDGFSFVKNMVHSKAFRISSIMSHHPLPGPRRNKRAEGYHAVSVPERPQRQSGFTPSMIHVSMP